MLPAKFRDRIKPGVFLWIVLVCDNQCHLDILWQQDLQAAHADIVVGENDYALHSGSCSSMAAIW
jgi:hypothetical protein